jgi:NADH-quinone oxidoreductase subunit E
MKTVLTHEIRKEIQERFEMSLNVRGACIDALTIVQEHYGWVSDDAVEELAGFLSMTPEELDGVATFYNNIYRKPIGRHLILICDSVTCWIMGYDCIRAHLNEKLGIDLGETTPDGRFTLLPAQCLGACDSAPAMLLDGRLYTDLEPDRIDAILAEHP